MNKHKDRRGFTMAELLIVVVIIGVLAAVSFVAVAQHQRSLERLERDSVAREIFVAAQNHLTMAQGQGYLGLYDQCGETEDAAKGYYYFATYRGDKLSGGEPASLLDLMLPFGAIDETVRGGGSYIIRYHRDTATVMDVFYCSTDDRYGYDLRSASLSDLLDGYTEGKEAARRNFNGKVLGWYGGAEAETMRLEHEPLALESPILEVENAERLRVLVQDPNSGDHDLQIIVTGASSGAKKTFTLKSTSQGIVQGDRITGGATVGGVAYDHVILLDDITAADTHFADLTADIGVFIPGEDVVIQAIAFNNTVISNIAYSAERTTNSLYESVALGPLTGGSGGMTASVGNIRHLENLDPSVSGVATTRTVDGASYALQAAVQTDDMDWTAFTGVIGGSVSVYPRGDGATPTDAGCYLPVNPTHALSYDGQGHSISNVKVDYAGEAGLFGALTGAGSGDEMTAVRNLALIDFDIAQKESADGNAGALAGTLSNVKVSNVVAYGQSVESAVTAKSGSAGGLIGSANGCTVEKSAASVYVTSDARDAGGLIGSASGGSVTGCYAGGHTSGGAYDSANFNVTASGIAGGLIGSAVSVPIEKSYSTCSATGATAGGLVGSANAAITDCYATGLVSGSGSEGAFAGQAAVSGLSGCKFLETVNQRPLTDAEGNATGGFELMPAIGNEPAYDDDARIAAIDANADAYDAFVGAPKDENGQDLWDPASPYDSDLLKYYGGRYPLKTVAQLGASIQAEVQDSDDNVITSADFVAIHYGDWPAPEIFVINE